ncbi:hypothetical protein PCANC_16692 [Puccinia coronata f. sp. avenae]|uniref:Uncharacterized protein n=1 Tax=Puccinia coronata f. sp. avenae TaxID=200324 RepID=A0A2N5SJA6_9BASI|nr:hypothetical protein PCANC_16692 [Puccinia coronata f. sp. avenae]
MLEEISQNKPLYSKLQGGKKSIDQIIDCLHVEDLKTKIGVKKWLSKFSHGQILSSLYRRPIVFLALEDSRSFLPLQLGPNSGVSNDPIYLLYVKNKTTKLAWQIIYRDRIGWFKTPADFDDKLSDDL